MLYRQNSCKNLPSRPHSPLVVATSSSIIQNLPTLHHFKARCCRIQSRLQQHSILPTERDRRHSSAARQERCLNAKFIKIVAIKKLQPKKGQKAWSSCPHYMLQQLSAMLLGSFYKQDTTTQLTFVSSKVTCMLHSCFFL